MEKERSKSTLVVDQNVVHHHHDFFSFRLIALNITCLPYLIRIYASHGYRYAQSRLQCSVRCTCMPYMAHWHMWYMCVLDTTNAHGKTLKSELHDLSLWLVVCVLSRQGLSLYLTAPYCTQILPINHWCDCDTSHRFRMNIFFAFFLFILLCLWLILFINILFCMFVLFAHASAQFVCFFLGARHTEKSMTFVSDFRCLLDRNLIAVQTLSLLVEWYIWHDHSFAWTLGRAIAGGSNR